MGSLSMRACSFRHCSYIDVLWVTVISLRLGGPDSASNSVQATRVPASVKPSRFGLANAKDELLFMRCNAMMETARGHVLR